MINKLACSLAGALCLAAVGWSAVAADGEAAKPAVAAVPDGMVLVPSGDFVMGSNKKDTVGLQKKEGEVNPYGFVDSIYLDEYPPHKLFMPAFYLDKYEVSREQYKEFVIQTRYRSPYMWPRDGYNASDATLSNFPLERLRQVALDYFKLDIDVSKMEKDAILTELFKMQRYRDKLPVTSVSWEDAEAYCAWAEKRLPTEAEWEKAARGAKSFEYPWGNEWDVKKVNSGTGESEAAQAWVGSKPGDVSPYGVYDMAGNVSEWVADWYGPYTGSGYQSKDFGQQHRVVRGGMASAGHYDTLSYIFRAARRSHLNPKVMLVDLGFRCAKDAP
jgi:formylglycine-generating enzyme required for sulfatase activity